MKPGGVGGFLIAGIVMLSSLVQAGPSRLYGYVRNGGSGIDSAEVLLFDAAGDIKYRDHTDGAGLYTITNIAADTYYIKAEVDNYADEWYTNAFVRNDATGFTIVADTTTNRCDFDLETGQSPALVRVVSLPTNAVVYIDYLETTNRTPTVIDIGQAASRSAQLATHTYWQTNASHVISVKVDGYPLPPPQKVPGLEAETCIDYFCALLCDDYFAAGICDDYMVPGICPDCFIAGIDTNQDRFDLTSSSTGSITVATTPVGASVYVDSTDNLVGVSPINIGNLYQGWHTVFLKRDGYLLPKTVRVFVEANTNTDISVNMYTAGGSGTNITANIESIPTNAVIYPDYFLTTNTTDRTMDGFDHHAFSTTRYYSVSQPVTVRKTSYLTPHAQHIQPITNSTQTRLFVLIGQSTNSGVTPPPTPTGLTASDGTYTNKIRVTWNSVGSATGYKLFRGTENNSGIATNIAVPSGTSWDDTNCTANTLFHYWVKAENSAGTSDFSDPDTGYRANPPQPPTGVTASDGDYDNKVRITWNIVGDATGYRIYRYTTDQSASAELIGSAETNLYDDASAQGGILYYYWAKATNVHGAVSDFSNPDSGYRALSAPGSVAATDGEYINKVRVTWTQVSSAENYLVYRNISNHTASATQMGTTTNLLYDDESGTANVVYYYWVKAEKSSMTSDYAGPDTGYSTSSLPSTLYGYVLSGEDAISEADVRMFNDGGSLCYSAQTDNAGLYTITGIVAATYYIKGEAPRYADEWYDNVMHRDYATGYMIADGTTTNRCDFNLDPGQSPALVRVLSYPTNALIYVDYHPTTNRTPATVNVGEAAPRNAQLASHPMWLSNASHIITVRLDGFPLPVPQTVAGLEGETCEDFFSTSLWDDYFVAGYGDDFLVSDMCLDYFIAGLCGDYFDLTSTDTGSLYVETTPPASRVYVDSADVPVGISPITVTNLLQGWHSVLIEKGGHLQTKLIRVFVVRNATAQVNVSLSAFGYGSNISAAVESLPSDANVYEDYLAGKKKTDCQLTRLDRTSPTGMLVYSVSHPIVVKKDGYLTPYAKHILTAGTCTDTLTFELISGHDNSWDLPVVTAGDFTGDGISDLAVYDPTTGAWYIRDGNSVGTALRAVDTIIWGEQWGGPGYTPVPGDYDGDGAMDMAVYCESDGAWYIRNVSGTTIAWGEQWGSPGMTPVPGDFDADGVSDLALYDGSTGYWYVRTLEGTVCLWGDQWGGPAFLPVQGAYDLDNASDFTVYDEQGGYWYIRTLNGTTLSWADQWGAPGLEPVSGDFDGDGVADLALYYEAAGYWYVRSLSGAVILWGTQWGGPGMSPVAGDFDGDGLADTAVYDRATGLWYARSLTGEIVLWAEQWGSAGLSPIE